MDPVSFAASIATLLGMAKGVEETIRALLRVKNASKELQSLINDLTDLCTDLAFVRTRASSLKATTNKQDIQYLGAAIVKTQNTIDKAKGLVVRKLSKNHDSKPKPRLFGYLKRDRLQRLHRDIMTCRADLRACFSESRSIETINILSKLESAIDTIASDHACNAAHGEMTQDVSMTAKNRNYLRYSALIPPSVASTKGAKLNSSLRSSSATRTKGFHNDECVQLCPCRCHSSYAFRTPKWMNFVLGTIFCQYTGRFVHHWHACNTPKCRRTDKNASLEYAFPTWAFRMAVIIRGGWSQLGGISATWSFKTPVYIPDTAIGLRRMLETSCGNHDRLHEYMHEHHVQPNARDPVLDNTLLDLALAHNNFGVCNFLIDIGAELSAFGSGPDSGNAWSPAKHAWFRLLISDPSNDPQAVILIMRLKKADTLELLNLSTSHKLIAGLQLGSLEKWLNTHPEDLVAKDPWGNPPLFWAARRGNHKALKTLLRYGADARARNSMGTTALHMAARGKSEDASACVRTLISNGADVNALNRLGETSARSPLAFAVTSGNLELVNLLLDHKAEADPPGFPPLAEAAFQGRADIVQRLINEGANIDRLTVDGYPAVENAVCSHNVECVKLLLDAGAKLNYVDKKGLNILDSAACDAGIEMMELLTTARIRGLDTSPAACAKYWHKFEQERAYNMSVRQPVEEERAAFHELLKSVTDISQLADEEKAECFRSYEDGNRLALIR